MRKQLAIVVLLMFVAFMGQAEAANYMYEKDSVKGVGYVNVERLISLQNGFDSQKLVEKKSGSGNVVALNTELEAERQLNGLGGAIGSKYVPAVINETTGEIISEGYWDETSCAFPTGTEYVMDYINFSQEAEFEY